MSVLHDFKNWLKGPEIAIFHEFHKPPYGGGNQFLLALEKELENKRINVGRNKVGENTRAILFNSYNFDFEKLKKIKEKYPRIKMVHRVDGPISIYRCSKEEIDKNIWRMNHELADATIFQSEYSRNRHLELGLDFKNTVVIPNAADPEIFNTEGRLSSPDGNRKIKLIATAWSDNPKKGGSTLRWLDENLDYDKYELTFVGRSKTEFKKAKSIPPLSSGDLSKILKENDIYIAPSQDDPCSNALIEALSCGLPAVFLFSGGHPELVKDGGVSFTGTDDLLEAINRLASNYESYQKQIKIMKMPEVAKKYLDIL